MKQIPSPNFEDRKPGISLDYIVMHYTERDEATSIALLCDGAVAKKVSAHYVIGERGNKIQLVDESKRAFHAGAGEWRGVTDINSASIGIELVNLGNHPFPPAQIAAAIELVGEIVLRNHMDPRRALVGHSDVAVPLGRKTDPGVWFPWKEFAGAGYGFWPTGKDYSPWSEAEVIKLLHEVGYETTQPKATLLEFQRRYYPENLTGITNPETVARLRALHALTLGP